MSQLTSNVTLGNKKEKNSSVRTKEFLIKTGELETFKCFLIMSKSIFDLRRPLESDEGLKQGGIGEHLNSMASCRMAKRLFAQEKLSGRAANMRIKQMRITIPGQILV